MITPTEAVKDTVAADPGTEAHTVKAQPDAAGSSAYEEIRKLWAEYIRLLAEGEAAAENVRIACEQTIKSVRALKMTLPTRCGQAGSQGKD